MPLQVHILIVIILTMVIVAIAVSISISIRFSLFLLHAPQLAHITPLIPNMSQQSLTLLKICLTRPLQVFA